MKRSRFVRRLAAVCVPLAAATALVGAAASASAASPSVSPSAESPVGFTGEDARFGERRCVRQFDEAQRIDMESFRDYDAEAFRDIHTADAVSIFSGGQRFAGIDAIMAALNGHFTGREAQWTWTEINRRVDGCKSAFIEYETVYAIPRINLEIRALTAVSYVRERGEWKAVLDQATALPAPARTPAP